VIIVQICKYTKTTELLILDGELYISMKLLRRLRQKSRAHSAK
jgi:hypothetical protein